MTKTKFSKQAMRVLVVLIVITLPFVLKFAGTKRGLDEEKRNIVVDQSKSHKDVVATTQPIDSVFLAILCENNFVQLLGEDDMPVLSFQLPQGEQRSEQVLTLEGLTIDYALSSSPGFLCRFEFRMKNRICDFASDSIYNEWRNQTFSNITFSKGIGRPGDFPSYQSLLYAFHSSGHCFTFGTTFHPLSDTVDRTIAYNEVEGVNLIESSLKSIVIY